jgi:hypothetical protein
VTVYLDIFTRFNDSSVSVSRRRPYRYAEH